MFYIHKAFLKSVRDCSSFYLKSDKSHKVGPGSLPLQWCTRWQPFHIFGPNPQIHITTHILDIHLSEGCSRRGRLRQGTYVERMVKTGDVY